jgi:glycosyltransferase involved in cell wall biosynthesis
MSMMTGSVPLLTICIPTFERYPFLKWTLDRTMKDFPNIPIVISDNASEDALFYHTENLAQITYIHQKTNIGAFANMRAALLAADTKYCVFLADDDYLVMDEVAKGIEYLEANPDVVAYYAPCQLYDEVRGQANWDAFYAASDQKFERADLLWNFIMSNHVWPEHAIYRREHLQNIMRERAYAYWAFVDLANAVKCGNVYFAKTPYYRNITAHPIGGRVKLGDRQCLTDFDIYRAGLEVLAYDLFGKYLATTPGMQRDIQRGIDQFIWVRLEVAHRLRKAQRDVSGAEEFYKRLVIARPSLLEAP